jgi:hypothetical protein
MNFESFAPCVGERFEALPEDSLAVAASIVLVKAELHPKASAETSRPFSLEFRAEEGEADLAQGTYRLRTARRDEELIFIVPIGPRRYEAIFN